MTTAVSGTTGAALPRESPGAAMAAGACAVAVLVTGGALGLAAERGAAPLAAIAGGVLATVAVVAWPRRALIGVVLVSVCFPVGVNVWYREDVAAIGGLGGAEVGASTVAVALLVGLWSLGALAGLPTPRPVLREAAPLVAHVLLGIASLAVAADRLLGTHTVLLQLEVLAIFVVLGSQVGSDVTLRFATRVLLGSALGQAVVIVGAALGLRLPLRGRVDVSPELDAVSSRFGGTIGSPNTAGGVMAAMLVLAVALALAPIDRGTRRLAILVMPLASTAVVLTASRGAWTASGVGVVLVLLHAARRGRVPLARAAPVALVLVLVLVPMLGLVQARLTSDDGGAAASRGPLVELAVEVIEANPLTGVGVNNVGAAMAAHADAAFAPHWFYTVHNRFLLVWAEAGPLAPLAVAWFILAAIRRGWRVPRRAGPLPAAVGAGCGAAMAGLVLQMLVEPFQSRPQQVLLAVLAALTVAATVRDDDAARSGVAP